MEDLQTLTIKVKLESLYSDNDLKIRYILAATLEEHEIGDVWDECIGEDFMEVRIDVNRSEAIDKEVKSILKSLGLLDNSELTYSEKY